MYFTILSENRCRFRLRVLSTAGPALVNFDTLTGSKRTDRQKRMDSTLIEILIVAALIVANGLFAMSEIALVSVRKARMQKAAQHGLGRAKDVLHLQASPNLFLSTIQVWITLIGILAGAYGGASLSQPVAEELKQYAWLAPYAETVALGLVVLLITYASLVVGELVPKRLGMNYPERISLAMVPFMTFFTRVLSPIVRFLSLSTELVFKLFPIPNTKDSMITEDEVRFMIRQGTQEGLFNSMEKEIMERVLRLSDRSVSLLMTLRSEIVWLNLADTEKTNLEKLMSGCFARYPLADGTLDHMIGVVHVTDILAPTFKGDCFDWKHFCRPPLFVPENTTGLKLLERFKQSGIHIAFVSDEFGSIEGLVTLTDLLEAIVGDMPDPGEAVEAEIIERSDGTWLLDGYLNVEEFKDRFHITDLPEEDAAGYQTLGGFVMTFLGKIPHTGDCFSWDKYEFEIVDMDGKRIDKVLMKKAPNRKSDS